MASPVVDCRSLIEFCKAYAENRHIPNQTHPNSRTRKHCDSPFVAIDILILLLVVGALGTLTVPYMKFVFGQIVPAILDTLREAPVPYVAGSVVGLFIAIGVWEIVDQQSRKCGKPRCKGLRKAVEFDIQLESEECVKCLPPDTKISDQKVQPLELALEDHKELQAELKRMAPLNGRTVLIFRAPCGCPLGRMEVWGPKKLRRIKK
ncbi:uncharacterized protein At5g19025-like [Malania oleifera]|uniref:uncharacterized protein At5g19025-like n=1 Tax=Malania oleifera TaxID=397392 RepID=UPI0025AE86BC|nr:uncharacterized protein At5g19025-like [Malania oleifera]